MRRKILFAIIILAVGFLTVDAWIYPKKHEEPLPTTQIQEFSEPTETTLPDYLYLTRSFEASRSVFGNPLMGYAEQADEETIGKETTLVYINVTWREWEPQMDYYDIEGIISTHQINRWKSEGKHAVLRFICDLPSEDNHMDIPDWLYAATGNAGTFYNNDYGRGFSPDYTNAYFIQRHAIAVRALGAAFGQDTFISYIQMGSLGHWGEWHVYFESGIPRLPREEIRNAYVAPWEEAFPHAKIMMRRPFPIAASRNYGLFNDIIGNSAGTREWLDWIQYGGSYDQTLDISDTLKPMPDFWKTAPSGGEITSSISMRKMMTDNLPDVLLQLQDSHTTFIGPNTVPPKYKEAYSAILDTLGYKFYITQAALKQDTDQLTLTTVWTNDGIAPIYWDWPVYIYIKDDADRIIGKVPVDIQLTTLLPDIELTTITILPLPEDMDPSECTYWVGIEDPETGRPCITFSMYTEQHDGMALLF